jgi:chromosome segregation ATPase
MATRWQVDMQERIENVEAVDGEFRGRFDAIDRRFDAIDRRFEAIDLRFEAIDRRFEAIDLKFDAIDLKFEAIDLKFEAIDRRFDEVEERLGNKIDMQVEHFEELVNRTAESFSGVLSRLERQLKDLTDEIRQERTQTALIFGNHEGRISALERHRPS